MRANSNREVLSYYNGMFESHRRRNASMWQTPCLHASNPGRQQKRQADGRRLRLRKTRRSRSGIGSMTGLHDRYVSVVVASGGFRRTGIQIARRIAQPRHRMPGTAAEPIDARVSGLAGNLHSPAAYGANKAPRKSVKSVIGNSNSAPKKPLSATKRRSSTKFMDCYLRASALKTARRSRFL